MWTLHVFSKNKWTQKYNVPVKKKKSISIQYISFFSFLLIHGTLSFHLKLLFHIRIHRHFSNPAMVYNTGHSDQQMEKGSNQGPHDPHVH